VPIIQIANFGILEGKQSYRISGDKKDLIEIIDACKEEQAKYEYELKEVDNKYHTLWLSIEIEETVE
jgi:hypothetical protein